MNLINDISVSPIEQFRGSYRNRKKITNNEDH